MVKKKTKKKIKPSKKEAAPKEVPIKWHIPDNINTQFVTNATVQILEEEFKISFFEMKPQLRFDLNVPPPSEVQADCVVSVVMTPNRVGRLIEALQGQLDKYNARQDEIKK